MGERDPIAEARTAALRARAMELGFAAVGFAPATDADPDGRLRKWLERGYAADMEYMARDPEVRADPRRLLPGARSVIALAIPYHRADYTPSPPLAVSRYAVLDDYHNIVRRKVRKLRKRILELDPSAQAQPTVDTSPVLERAWAERAGIAWTGKSTMAIGTRLGTYTFLATVITTMELIYDAPHANRCGTCTACLDACPTDAFDGPYVLDANKCITYWNVETRAPFTEATPELHGWLAGCDVCQEVCPWNKFAREATEPRFVPHPDLARPDAQRFTDPAEHEALAQTLAGTPLQRTGAAALRRTALKILGRTPPD